MTQYNDGRMLLCCMICIFIIFIGIGSFFIIGENIRQTEYDSYNKNECNVSYIDLPMDYPYDNISGWIVCENFVSFMPCIKLYSGMQMIYNNYDNSEYYSIFNGNIYKSECSYTLECAFDIDSSYLDRLEQIKNDTLNSNIDCYYENENSDKYLTKTDFSYWRRDFSIGILVIGFVALLMTCCGAMEICGTPIRCRCKNNKIKDTKLSIV